MKMTRLFLLSMLCLLASLALQAQSDAFYVYRNDGQFNAFFDADVDSITYSHYDADSLYHTDWQMQVVYTADSVYQIPLEVIDSVAFKPVEPILNADVFPLTKEHSPYILSADTLTFTMKRETPKELLPRKGHIVVAAYDCEAFPNGIMAKVVAVGETLSGIFYTCEPASLDDVYDQILYYGVCGEDSPSTRAMGKVGKILWDEDFEETIEKSGTTTRLTGNDVSAFEITLQKTLGRPLYARIILANNFRMNVEFNAKSEADISASMQLGPTVNCGRIAIPQFPLIWFVPQMRLYGYFEEEGSVELDLSAHLNRRDKVTMTYADKQWDIDHQPTMESGVDVASLSMKGSAEVGLMPEIRLALNGSPICIGLNLRCGLKQYCDFKFDAKAYFDAGVYDALKDTKFHSAFTRGGSVFAQAGFLEKDANRASKTLFSNELPVGNERYLLPLFTEPEYTEESHPDGESVTYHFTTSVSRDLLLPVEVGFSICDADDEPVASRYHKSAYQQASDWQGGDLKETFENIPAGKASVCYPMVKLFGCEFRATPSKKIGANLCNDEHHVHAVDLGLSVKWACCNVGATVPEGYGGYYACGETEEKTIYTEETYQYARDLDGDGNYWDNLDNWINIGSNISGTQYDVAHVKWGENWRMPTLNEIQELVNKCIWRWITLNGIKGQLVTGPNGNSIFLPAAGACGGEGLGNRGLRGLYRSALLDERESYNAYSLSFDSGGKYWRSWDNRFSGQSVRPVTD